MNSDSNGNDDRTVEDILKTAFDSIRAKISDLNNDINASIEQHRHDHPPPQGGKSIHLSPDRFDAALSSIQIGAKTLRVWRKGSADFPDKARCVILATVVMNFAEVLGVDLKAEGLGLEQVVKWATKQEWAEWKREALEKVAEREAERERERG